MPSMSWKLVGSLFLASALLLTYQNCGNAGFDNVDFDDMASITQDQRLASLPFPYDVRINQIAHMSCSFASQPASSSKLFTVKVGAYDNVGTPTGVLNVGRGGVHLNEAFLQGWAAVAPSFNASVQAKKFEEALSGNPLAAGAQMQLSFRDASSVKTLLGTFSNPSGSTYNSPTVSILEPINQPSIYKEFVSNMTADSSYFPLAQTRADGNIEAALRFPSSLQIQNISQNALIGSMSGSLLTVGFAGGSGNGLIGPSEDVNSIHGQTFRLSFAKPPQYTGAQFQGPLSVMSSISEEAAETSAAGSLWPIGRCYHFKIVKPEHRMNLMFTRDQGTQTIIQTPICPPEPLYGDSSAPTSYERSQGLYQNTQRPAVLHAMRRFFPPSDFDINVSKGCIVPLREAELCYGGYGSNVPAYADAFVPPPDANTAEGGYLVPGNPASPRYHSGCGGTLIPCAHYTTICLAPN